MQQQRTAFTTMPQLHRRALTHQLLHHLNSCAPITHSEQQVQGAPPDGYIRVLEVPQYGRLHHIIAEASYVGGSTLLHRRGTETELYHGHIGVTVLTVLLQAREHNRAPASN